MVKIPDSMLVKPAYTASYYYNKERNVMTFIAAAVPCGAAGYTWDTAGEKGAQEVDFRTAQELLAIPGDNFSVAKRSEKVTQEDEDARQKAFDDAEAEKVRAAFEAGQVKAGATVETLKTPKVAAKKTVKIEDNTDVHGPNNA